jgi:hypothetical protein
MTDRVCCPFGCRADNGELGIFGCMTQDECINACIQNGVQQNCLGVCV